MEREFKGVWFPKEVWLDERLSALDKIILLEIDSLDNEEKGCYASNEYLAEFCQCSERKITESISKLIKCEYLYVESFNGRTRVLKSILSNCAKQSSKNCEAEKQIFLQRKIKDNTNKDINTNNINTIKENKKENVDYSGMETINPKIANQLVEGSNVLKIFHHWNEANIIQHRELTTGIKKQIDKALKEYSIDQIKLAISHYAEAFHSDYKYCDYKWSLEKFLKQDNCLKDFLDDGTKWNNYLDYKNKKSNPYSSNKEVSKETAYTEHKDKNYW